MKDNQSRFSNKEGVEPKSGAIRLFIETPSSEEYEAPSVPAYVEAILIRTSDVGEVSVDLQVPQDKTIEDLANFRDRMKEDLLRQEVDEAFEEIMSRKISASGRSALEKLRESVLSDFGLERTKYSPEERKAAHGESSSDLADLEKTLRSRDMEVARLRRENDENKKLIATLRRALENI